MSDGRLRELERLVAAGDLDPRSALAARDRVRPPLLPVLAYDDLHGSGWGCVGDAACLGWSGRAKPWAGGLPSGECVLPPWRNVAVTACEPQRHEQAVLCRELVTGRRVLVADRPCERCGGWGWEGDLPHARCRSCRGHGRA